MARQANTKRLAQAIAIVKANADKPMNEVLESLEKGLGVNNQMARYWLKKSNPENWPKRSTSLMNDVKGVLSLPSVEQTASDDEILKNQLKRFEVLNMMARSVKNGSTRSLVITGASGVGKSYDVEQVFADMRENDNFMYHKGFMRTTGLYKSLYDYRNAGDTIIIDDGDSILLDNNSLNLLKSALDTSKVRRVGWKAETRMVSEKDGQQIPTSFIYEGSMIFISNYDFDAMVEKGHHLAEHLEAFMSRSHYIDIGIRTKRDYIVRMNYVVYDLGMLRNEGFNAKEEKIIMQYIEDNFDYLRKVTLRSISKVAENYRIHGDHWQEVSDVTVLKGKI